MNEGTIIAVAQIFLFPDVLKLCFFFFLNVKNI